MVQHLIRILQGAFLWRFSRHVLLVGDPGVDPELARGIIYLIWNGNATGSSRRSWKTCFCWGPTRMRGRGWMDGQVLDDRWMDQSGIDGLVVMDGCGIAVGCRMDRGQMLDGSVL